MAFKYAPADKSSPTRQSVDDRPRKASPKPTTVRVKPKAEPAPTVDTATPVSAMSHVQAEEAIMAERARLIAAGTPVPRVGTTPVKLRIPNDILATFKATGAGWQTRMVIALRRAMSDVQYPTS